MMSDVRFSRIHPLAAACTLLLHAALTLALLAGSSGGAHRMPAEKPIPVQLIQTENPKDIAAQYGRAGRKAQRAQEDNKAVSETEKASSEKSTEKPENRDSGPSVPESIVDCRHMDEAACSPCLADPKICTACCQKSDKPGAGGTDPNAPSSPAGTCLNPPCAETDPCPPEMLAEMTSSFCPRVRASIYARLGTVRLDVPEDASLSARIQVSVNAAGVLNLQGLLSSSGNAAFDQAVRDSVSKAAGVVPPARILGCVAARGCIFPVTIGAAKAPPADSPRPPENAP